MMPPVTGLQMQRDVMHLAADPAVGKPPHERAAADAGSFEVDHGHREMPCGMTVGGAADRRYERRDTRQPLTIVTGQAAAGGNEAVELAELA